MAEMREFYRTVKIAGMLTFIPMVLVSGPFAGYALGAALVHYLHWPAIIIVVSIALGVASSIIEVYRIIKAVRAVDRSSVRKGKG